MSFNRKKVCIIGAGISGLVTLKEMLDLDQEVVCFESMPNIGGVFAKSGINTQAYDSLLLTTSNYAMAFSSFPPPEGESRHFWTAKRYVKYLNEFTDHFNLDPYIEFNTKVIDVSKCENGYLVCVEGSKGEEKAFFDSIAICSGVFAKNKWPDLPFIGEKKIKVSHTSDYKDNLEFYNKKVLCIGMGESGADIVNEISKVAEKSYLILRESPPPVIPRYPKKGFTNDAFTTDLTYQYFLAMSESGLAKELNQLYEKIGFEPVRDLNYSSSCPMEREIYETYKKGHYDCDPLSRFLTKNEGALKQKIRGKAIFHYSAIERIEGHKVFLQNGKDIEVDHIVCNTGYHTHYPFLCGSLSSYRQLNCRNLYKNMFPSDLNGSLAFIGSSRPAQGYFPALSEMQARLFAAVTANQVTLPATEEMRVIIQKDKNKLDQMFHRESNTSLVQYPFYADDLAKLLGCFPSRWRYFLQPALGLKLFFGAKISNRYRLDGPGKSTKMSKNIIKKLPIAHAWVSIFMGSFLIILLYVISKILLFLRRIVFMLKGEKAVGTR